MQTEFESVFSKLRALLRKHAGSFAVTEDSPTRYCLEGQPDSATLKAWGGKARRSKIPVAWVQIGKGYVSYHLMGLYMNPVLQKEISKPLRTRMQGKSCFNFKKKDDDLFTELEQLTMTALAAFQKAGYLSGERRLATNRKAKKA